MEQVKGYVEHITFRNEENGYSVFHLSCDSYEELTCVGYVSFLNEGDYLLVEGNFVEHPVYGRQLSVQTAVLSHPDDLLSIERYLASGAIKGIGAKLAHLITAAFGEDTFRIMEEEPERLAEIKGISMRKAMDISLQMDEKQDMRRAMLFLQGYGISNNLAVKIFGLYGSGLYRIIEENPYQLAEDIDGVGFKTADEIALRAGIEPGSDFRIRCGLVYILQQAAAEGHCYLPKEVLLQRGGELLGAPNDQLQRLVMDLAIERRIVLSKLSGEDDRYAAYLMQYYHLERSTARMLHELNIPYPCDPTELKDRIGRVEQAQGITLDEMQQTAVMEAVKHGLMIITGGPGTGKTTTINTLIRCFEEEGMDIALAAPTGRAARRMKEATGREAQTIHRLLEVTGMPQTGKIPGSGRKDLSEDRRIRFARNAENPLEYDLVIIDEVSMVDIHLMHALLCALEQGTRLVLVGDVHQLPSVGPGSVLRDIIDSHCFNVVMLTKIFRQAAMSDIIVNAHRIQAGEEIDLSNDSRDFFFLSRSDPNLIISNLITLIQKKLPPYVQAAPSEIQVLTPMRKGVLGVERLNRILQQYLNPPGDDKPEKQYGERLFRTGDKVMQIRNNYELEWEIFGKSCVKISGGTGVFNGDTGVVSEINHFDETVTVLYEESKEVRYSFSQLDELELAYAITIHKAQGSEYPAVLIPVLSGPELLFTRNLLYTAITRARKCVTILGSADTVGMMIQNTHEQTRYTELGRWICEEV